jgi:chromosome segregation ATPase
MQQHIDHQTDELNRQRAEKAELMNSSASTTNGANSIQQKLEQALNSALAELDTARAEMEKKTESFEKELKAASQNLADQKAEDAKASDEYGGVKEKLDAVEKEKEDLARQVEDFKATIKEHETNQSSAEASQSQLIAKANSSRSDFERKLIQAQAQLQRAHKEHKASEQLRKNELEALKKQLNEQLQLNEKSSTDQNTVQEISEKAEREKADLLTKIQNLERELMSGKSQHEHIIKSHDVVLSDSKSREEELKTKLKAAEANLKHMQDDNETGTQKLLSDQQVKLRASEEELQAIKKELDEQKMNGQQSLDEHIAKVNHVQEAYDAAQQTISVKDKELKKAQEDHESLRQNYENVNTALVEHQQMSGQIPGLEAQISELLKKEEEASKNLIVEQAATERLQVTLNSLNETLNSSTSDNDAKLQNLIMSHSKEKAEWDEATSNLRNQVSEIEELTVTLRGTVAQQEQAIKEKEQQLTALNENVDSAKSITNQIENENNGLQKELITLKGEYDHVIKQKEETQVEIEQHLANITELRKSEKNVSLQLDKLLQEFEAYRTEAEKGQEATSSKHKDTMEKAAQAAIDRENELQESMQKLETEIEQHVADIAQLRESHADTSSQHEKALQDFETHRADMLQKQEAMSLKHREVLDQTTQAAVSREQELQTSLQNLGNEIEQHVSTIDQLRESQSDASSKLEKALQEFETYRADALKEQEATSVKHQEAIEKATQDALSQEKEMKEKLQELENKIDQHVFSISELRDSKADTFSQLEKAMQEFQAYRTDMLKGQEASATKHREAMDRATQEALHREQELQASLQKLQSEIEQHVANITELSDAKTDTASQLEQALQEFETFRANTSKDQEESESNHRTAMDRAAQDAVKREEELLVRLDELKNDIQRIDAVKLEIEQQKSGLQIELEELKVSYETPC